MLTVEFHSFLSRETSMPSVAVILTLPFSGVSPKPFMVSSLVNVCPLYASPKSAVAGVTLMSVGMVMSSAMMPCAFIRRAHSLATSSAPVVLKCVLP